jgi:hypothetical protein
MKMKLYSLIALTALLPSLAFGVGKLQNEDFKSLPQITAVITITGNLTSGSACITSPSTTTGISAGLYVYDTTTSTNIPTNPTVVGVPGTCSAGSIQVSANAAATATGDTITFGGTAAQLLNDTKIYITANGINQQLSQAISSGVIATTTTSSLAPNVQNFLSIGSGNYYGSVWFIVNSANATAGAVYTSLGRSFTVVNTISGGTALLTTSGSTGFPTSSVGTLTKTSGTGDATITFTNFKTPLYSRVRLVGGGGGGAASGNGGGAGGAGGNSTFGTSTATGGGGGSNNAKGPGSVCGTIGSGIQGIQICSGYGESSGRTGNSMSGVAGGNGGTSFFSGGGAGGSGANQESGSTAFGYGGGGGGGSCSFAQNPCYTGAGGAGGAGLDLNIQSPAQTYPYTVGTVGTAGTGPGSGGANGGAGAQGAVTVTDYFQ